MSKIPLTNGSTVAQRKQFLAQKLAELDDPSLPLFDTIYDIVGCSGLIFSPRDEDFTSICLYANDIEANPRPFEDDDYTLGLIKELKKDIRDYIAHKK